MVPPRLPRVLFVDDESALLDGLRRLLRANYELETATSGADALRTVRRAIENKRPFEVIVSDMQMPKMNGAAFLAQAREIDPDAVRMIMSGHADLASTIDAVNEGGILRFLTKPFETEDLIRIIDEAVAHYRLVVAERQLLEGTLRATVDLLADILATAVPVAYSRTTRLVALTDAATRRLTVKDWQLPIAARLSHLGCLGIPAELLLALDAGEELTEHERELYLGHPAAAATMLHRIPRLETVADWVGEQPLQGQAPPEEADTPELILHAASAVLHACDASHNAQTALDEVRVREVYPKAILDAFAPALNALTPEGVRREVGARELGPGMVLEDDIVSETGTVLVRAGERLSRTLAQRVREFADTVGVEEPIRVIVHGYR
jgi:FixJ family two-component response regulator